MGPKHPQSLYQPLDNPSKQIRLLEILSESSDELVNCKLHTVSLDEQPYHIYLSYVWGDPSVTQEITVDGIPIQVTANLAAALRYVKNHWISTQNELDSGVGPSEFRLWADAICINQSDLEERSAQVQLMGDLYPSAESMIAWLSTDAGIAECFQLFEEVYVAVRQYYGDGGTELSYFKGPDDVDWSEVLDPLLYESLKSSKLVTSEPEKPDDAWSCLVDFADNPFWSRVWIQQEITLPPRINFTCPSKTIGHDNLFVSLCRLLVRVFGKTTVFQFRDEWFRQAPLTLTRLEEGMVKLEMDVHGKWMWERGQHVFLKFIQLRPLDSHPFTIACLPDDRNPESTRMVFYIRPQRGLTAKIASSTKTLSATVNGPYGTILRPQPETGYDNVILVAGDGGFAGMLPHLQRLSRSISSSQSSVKKVEFIWVMRRKEPLTWCNAELKACKSLAPGSINLDIWITGDSEKGNATPDSCGKDIEIDAASTGSDHGWKDLLSSAHLGQRPVMDEVIINLVNNERVLILGCGPESLKIDLSNAVAILQARVLKGEVKRVSLHTDTFGW
ncbi:hypothetical protein ACHAPT_008624 [Fusarium lateritium]